MTCLILITLLVSLPAQPVYIVDMTTNTVSELYPVVVDAQHWELWTTTRNVGDLVLLVGQWQVTVDPLSPDVGAAYVGDSILYTSRQSNTSGNGQGIVGKMSDFSPANAVQ